MDNIIGIVTNLETKQGDRKDGKGKWTRHAFQLKDARGNVEWYSCFDISAKEIEVGQAYEFAYAIKDDYKNLSTWMTVDADAHGLSMSTPVVNSQDEFRRSKEEMRWTEAYHMATRVCLMKPIGDEPATTIESWAKWFYLQLVACSTPEAPETPVEAPAKVETPKASPKRGRPAKTAVEVPEPVSTAPDYQLLKAFNDARVAANMSMEDVNEYIAGRFDVDTVRKLSEEQLTELISYIENQT